MRGAPLKGLRGGVDIRLVAGHPHALPVKLHGVWCAGALVAALALAHPGAASGATPGVRLAPDRGAPGAVVTVAAHGLRRRAVARLTFAGRRVGRARVSRRGTVRFRVRVPSGSAGRVRVRVSVGRRSRTASFRRLQAARIPAPAPASAAAPRPGDSAIWRPGVATTWQMQLTGSIDQSAEAMAYDVDGFDTPAATVAALKAKGRKVICYFSAGSYENWRPDAGAFPAAVLGAGLDGWPGEKWLDVRRIDLLKPIMDARMDMCRAKGFDAVDPDNVDGYANATGFTISPADQLAYNRYLAEAAHARGLAIGLKNDLEQAAALQPSYEFAVNEQCFQYSECDALRPFIAAGKPVFNIEYSVATTTFCPKARTLGFMSARKNLDLDAGRTNCW